MDKVAEVENNLLAQKKKANQTQKEVERNAEEIKATQLQTNTNTENIKKNSIQIETCNSKINQIVEEIKKIESAMKENRATTDTFEEMESEYEVLEGKNEIEKELLKERASIKEEVELIKEILIKDQKRIDRLKLDQEQTKTYVKALVDSSNEEQVKKLKIEAKIATGEVIVNEELPEDQIQILKVAQDSSIPTQAKLNRIYDMIYELEEGRTLSETLRRAIGNIINSKFPMQVPVRKDDAVKYLAEKADAIKRIAETDADLTAEFELMLLGEDDLDELKSQERNVKNSLTIHVNDSEKCAFCKKFNHSTRDCTIVIRIVDFFYSNNVDNSMKWPEFLNKYPKIINSTYQKGSQQYETILEMLRMDAEPIPKSAKQLKPPPPRTSLKNRNKAKDYNEFDFDIEMEQEKDYHEFGQEREKPNLKPKPNYGNNQTLTHPKNQEESKYDKEVKKKYVGFTKDDEENDHYVIPERRQNEYGREKFNGTRANKKHR